MKKLAGRATWQPSKSSPHAARREPRPPGVGRFEFLHTSNALLNPGSWENSLTALFYESTHLIKHESSYQMVVCQVFFSQKRKALVTGGR